MKFIINGAYFKEKIDAAIKNKSFSFNVSNDTITFIGRDYSMKADFHPVIRADINEKFDAEKWRTISDFLGSIQEQPVTVEIHFNTIDIWAEATFRILDEEI